MKNRLYLLWCMGIIFLGLSGCMMKPSFINENDPEVSKSGVNISPVIFRTSQEFDNSPPQCIAVLPLTSDLKPKDVRAGAEPEKTVVLTEDQLKKIRWILYSHLAPFPFRDVELNKVDAIVKLISDKNYRALGKALHCDTFLTGEITAYATEFLGVYSQASIGTKLKLIRANDKKILWQGRHVVNSHDGDLPISPVGIVMAVFNASQNVNDEQMVRVTDVLFRRLLSTWDRSQTDNTPETRLVKQEVLVPPYSVTSKKLVLRSGPGKSHIAKSMLYRDDQLILVNREKTPWVKVKTADGRSGYVYGKYITQRQIEMPEIGLAQELSQEVVNDIQ